MIKIKKILIFFYKKKVFNKEIVFDIKQKNIIKKFQIFYQKITKKKILLKTFLINYLPLKKKKLKNMVFIYGDMLEVEKLF